MLMPTDPDAIEDRKRTGHVSKLEGMVPDELLQTLREQQSMGIIPEPKRADLNRAHANLVDQNPNVTRGQTRLCFSFLNKQTCDKPDCTFRHLLPGHPDWVADKLKKGHSVPGPMAAEPQW